MTPENLTDRELDVVCPYCGSGADLVSGQSVYPHRSDLFHKWFYMCSPCDARVGCHPKSKRPLGRLANSELRRWKMKAHAAFDPLWKSKKMSRKEAYSWLSDRLGIHPDETHIGMFDVEMCKKVIKAVGVE